MDKLDLFFKIAFPSDFQYINLIIKSLIVLLFMYIIKKIISRISIFKNNNKLEYKFYKWINIIITIITLLIIIFIWKEYIKNVMTLISLVSAAITIALRELIFNFFSGIYIKLVKPFKLEDRIEINGYKGDIVDISLTNFELLEVDNSDFHGQSTGIIITLPSSIIFTHPIRNYNKGFKYIWDEIDIKVPVDCDLDSQKKELYRIVNSIEIVKAIPKKMKSQINDVGISYRIYFNKYDPIVYTKLCDDCIELQIRYLVHPKKARLVQSTIYNKIISAYKENKINLYIKQ